MDDNPNIKGLRSDLNTLVNRLSRVFLRATERENPTTAVLVLWTGGPVDNPNLDIYYLMSEEPTDFFDIGMRYKTSHPAFLLESVNYERRPSILISGGENNSAGFTRVFRKNEKGVIVRVDSDEDIWEGPESDLSSYYWGTEFDLDVRTN